MTVHHTNDKQHFTWSKSARANASKAYLDYIFTRNV